MRAAPVRGDRRKDDRAYPAVYNGPLDFAGFSPGRRAPLQTNVNLAATHFACRPVLRFAPRRADSKMRRGRGSDGTRGKAMTEVSGYRREAEGGQPPYLWPAYGSTVKRAPKRPRL